MKTMLKQTSQSCLEARDGVLCVIMETLLIANDPALPLPPCGSGSGSGSRAPTRRWSPGVRFAISILERGYSSTKRGTATGWRVAVRPSPITPR
jgi:hypothetical protein